MVCLLFVVVVEKLRKQTIKAVINEEGEESPGLWISNIHQYLCILGLVLRPWKYWG